jgi:hypothetical protein
MHATNTKSDVAQGEWPAIVLTFTGIVSFLAAGALGGHHHGAAFAAIFPIASEAVRKTWGL